MRISIGLMLFCVAVAAVNADEIVRPIATPAPIGSHQHGLGKTTQGQLILSWVDSDKSGNHIRFATYKDGEWATPATVTTVAGQLGASPKILGLTDGALAAVWMDYPAAEKKSYRGRLFFSRSSDNGKTWSQPVQPYGDAAAVYDAQMSATPLPEGGLALVWTDMRAENSDHRFQLFATVINSQGKASGERSLDTDVCSCCPVDTAAEGNKLVTVYRDHLPGNVRDIGVVHWPSNSGETNGHNPVNEEGWVIDGCPSNGPAIALNKQQALAAWFTAVNDQGTVKAGFSSDGGYHFGKAVVLDNDASGYVDAALLDNGEALVSWRGREGPEDTLKLAKVPQDGSEPAPVEIFRGRFPRWPSRDPVLAVAGGQVFLAWTDGAAKQVKLSAVTLNRLK